MIRNYGDGITVTAYEIVRRRYAQAWPGSRALLCRACPTMSPSAVIGASPCFSRPTTIAPIAGWPPRRRAAPAYQSEPVV
jgi:hypothetical protein